MRLTAPDLQTRYDLEMAEDENAAEVDRYVKPLEIGRAGA